MSETEDYNSTSFKPLTTYLLGASLRDYAFITKIIERNVIGWEKCRGAIYQWYLIKRYGNCAIFGFLNRDVVNLIARLVYASRFTEVWCPLLQVP